MTLLYRVGLGLGIIVVGSGLCAAQDSELASTRQRIALDYASALTAFGRDKFSAEGPLDAVISAVAGLDDVFRPEEREILLGSLARRSELLFDLGRLDEARHDVVWLFQLDPDFQFDAAVVSPKFVDFVAHVSQELTGRLRLASEGGEARIWLDGRRVDGTRILRASPGVWELVVQVGPDRQELDVAVRPGREVAVEVAFPQRVEPRSSPRSATNEEQQRRPNQLLRLLARPPRILFVRLDGALDAYGQQFTTTSFFPLYSQVGQVTTDYIFDAPSSFEGTQIGATIRLYKHFALGVSRSKAAGRFKGEIGASVPSTDPRRRARSVGAVIGGLERSQELIHFELTVTAGGQDWEASAFVGPSYMTVTQELVSGISVREEGFGSARIIGVGTEQLQTDRTIGFNLGFDATYFFLRYFGLGGGVRYSRASVDLDARGGDTRVVIGGTQLAYGVRLRF